jgi:hypothetical protein
VLYSLERQFRETPLYDDIIVERSHQLRDGAIELSDAAGLGLDVAWEHAVMRQQASFDVDL